MTLILCLDDKNGMAFNSRRQSTDAALRARVLDVIGQSKLWMSKYSAKQFEPYPEQVIAADDFLEKVGTGEACFVELQDPSCYLHRCSKLIVYRWNRVYPADLVFPVAEHASRMRLRREEDFVGSSHERITEEIYEIV